MTSQAMSYERLEELVRISGKAIQGMRSDIAKLKGHLANLGVTVDDQCNIIASTASASGKRNAVVATVQAQQQPQQRTGPIYPTPNAILALNSLAVTFILLIAPSRTRRSGSVQTAAVAECPSFHPSFSSFGCSWCFVIVIVIVVRENGKEQECQNSSINRKRIQAAKQQSNLFKRI